MLGIKFSEIRDPFTNELLHLFSELDRSDFSKTERVDFVPEHNFLQGAFMQISEGSMFRPHLHLERDRRYQDLKAQECWVVMSGLVEVKYFDRAGKFLQSVNLGPGSISLTLHGGHGYKALENSIVYEFKSGPYEGQLIDKRFID